MPAYIVTPSASASGHTSIGGNNLVVFAASVADARAIAKGRNAGGDSDAMWAAATVTQIVAAANMVGFSLRLAIPDAAPVIDELINPGVVAVSAATMAAPGTLFATNEIVTVVGGTFTRAATFKVTAQTGGIPDTLALVDPGDYTVIPANPAATTTSLAGVGMTLTLTSANNTFASILGKAVTTLNANAAIAGAAVDTDAGLLTVSSVGDALGDKQLIADLLFNGAAIPGFLGAVTHQGASGAVLSVGVSPVGYTVPQVVGQF